MISIVIPLMNEEESLRPLYSELMVELRKLKKPYELLFIDDGSTDNSLSVLQSLAEKDKNIRIFSFRKNQGKAEALSLGFVKAKGEYIVTMDADLEDKPSELPHLLAKAESGWDVVSGWRKNRHHSIARVFSSRLSNFFIGLFWGLELHDYNCGYKIFTSEAAKSLDLYGGLYRFISLLAFLQGFTVSEVVVEHQNRKYGKSKFGFFKLWKDTPDIFTMLFLAKYGKRPLHFFGTVGLLFSLIGSVLLGYFWILHTFYNKSVGGRPLLFISMILIIAGLQIFFTGFIAELVTNGNNKSHTHPPLKYANEHV